MASSPWRSPPGLPALSDGFITIHDDHPPRPPPRSHMPSATVSPDFCFLESVHFSSLFHTTRTPAAAVFLVSLPSVSPIQSAGPSSQRALAEQMPITAFSLPDAQSQSWPPPLWGPASEAHCLPYEFPSLHPVYLCWSLCFKCLSCCGLPVLCPHLGETSLSQKGCFLSPHSLGLLSQTMNQS